MALKTVTPEIIGRVRGAQRNVRYIPTNEGKALQEAGRAVSGMGKMAAKGLDFMADLADERHRASYAKALAEAEAEAGKRFAEEVKQRVGFDAQGAAQLTQQIYSEVGAKYRSQVAERYQDQFDVNWTRHSGGQFRNATDFEFRNVRQATITATRQRMESARDRQDWEEMESAYDEQYRLINGGKAITGKSLEAFDRDIAEGKGVLTPDGKRLRVTEKDEGEGTISKERVAKVRASLETRVEAYNKGLTDLYDVSHARAVDAYLSQEDVLGAREYLMSIKEAGIPVSEKTYSSMEKVVARHEEVHHVKVSADKYVADAVAAGSNTVDSGKYGGPEQDYEFAKAISKEKNPHIVARARQIYELERRKQAALLQMDTIAFIKESMQGKDEKGNPVKLELSKQKENIDKLPDGPLKRAVTKIYESNVKEFERSLDDSPIYVAGADKRLNEFSKELTRGFYLDEQGRECSLKTPDQKSARVLMLNFTPKYRKLANGMIADSDNAVSDSEVENLFSKTVGRDATPADRETWIPLFQRFLEERRGGRPFASKSERNTWLKTEFSDVVKLEVEKTRNLWFDRNGTLGEFAKENDLPADEFYKLYFTDKQFEAYTKGHAYRPKNLDASVVDFVSKKGEAKSWAGGTEYYLARRPDKKSEKSPDFWEHVSRAAEFNDVDAFR